MQKKRTPGQAGAKRTAFFAHTTEDGRPWEPLHEHLSLVASRARDHAAAFGAGDEAYLAGLLHDLGKYGELFQLRLEGQGSGIDHWTLGAWAALMALKAPKAPGLAAALAIEGHHIGLQVGSATKDTILRFDPKRFADRHLHTDQRLSEPNLERALGCLAGDGLAWPAVERSLWRKAMPAPRGMLAVRMLFSALVDADYLETEAFMRPDAVGERAYRRTGPTLEAGRALGVLDDHLKKLASGSKASDGVAAMRAELLADCRAQAEEPQGTFTLTAPTGSGKTLSMLAFALAHAARHGLRRVVFAIPFLSIIEQTVEVYRDLFASAGFPDHYVLEHHSLSDARGTGEDGSSVDDGQQRDKRGVATCDKPRVSTRDARLLAENWDAPIVVTTNVQLLESLFAAKPRRCRKLHSLANSVILFDEAQTLPPKLARATLGALGALVRDFGCSVVFATATQPAFDHLGDAIRRFAAKDSTPDDERIGWQPAEIVRDAPAMFRSAKRTKVIWQIDSPTTWDDLADRLLDPDEQDQEQGQEQGGEQALVIVNLKRHARALAEALDARGARGLRHLSTNLCPAHRTEVLDDVRRRLADKKPCLLVSTQCVEAGVDVDFPTVFRALGPLESIAQAAGRCNRGGKRTSGAVVVFLPEDEAYPPGVYRQATQVTKLLVGDDRSLSIDDPESFRAYYRDFYQLTGSATMPDTKLEEAMRNADFPAVAKDYRLIEQDTIQVVVPWDEDLIDTLRRGPFDAQWIRRARAATVALYRPKPGAFPALESAPLTRRGETPDDWYLLSDPDAYDRRLYGLDLAERDLWIA